MLNFWEKKKKKKLVLLRPFFSLVNIDVYLPSICEHLIQVGDNTAYLTAIQEQCSVYPRQTSLAYSKRGSHIYKQIYTDTYKHK